MSKAGAGGTFVEYSEKLEHNERNAADKLTRFDFVLLSKQLEREGVVWDFSDTELEERDERDEGFPLISMREKRKELMISRRRRSVPLIPQRRLLSGVLGVTIIIVACVSAWGHLWVMPGGVGSIPSSIGNLTFTLTTSGREPLTSLDLLAWDHIAEPFVNTTLSAVLQGKSLDGYDISWRVTTKNQRGVESEEPIFVGFGLAVTLTFEAVTVTHVVTLLAVETSTFMQKLRRESGDAVLMHRAVIMCKYVRREIRSLSQDDLDRYFTALELVHRLPLGEGRRLYGPHCEPAPGPSKLSLKTASRLLPVAALLHRASAVDCGSQPY